MATDQGRPAPDQTDAAIAVAGDLVLDVDHLSTTFKTSGRTIRAVDDVSFSIGRGKVLGVVGESGSGKSAMARSIMRLLPTQIADVKGTVRLGGVDLGQLSAAQLRKVWGERISMVFQDPMTALNPVMRVGRQLIEMLEQHGELEGVRGADEAVRLLRAVGIPEPQLRARQYPHQLSGGMRQRVVIAIALACDPELLIADEPTTALDVTVQAQIMELLSKQQLTRGMAMMLVTHDLGVAAAYTDEVLVMYAGQVVEKAPTRRLFTQMRCPYTAALRASIPMLDQPSHTRLSSIAGRPPDLGLRARGCRFAPRCRLAQQRCLDEPPPLVTGESPDHVYRCFYPVGTEAGDEALAANMQRGRTASGLPITSESVPV
jgi:peptide/nickel transport system ATP-binding protein